MESGVEGEEAAVTGIRAALHRLLGGKHTPTGAGIGFDDLLRSNGSTFSAWLDARLKQSWTYADISDEQVARLKPLSAGVIKAADLVMSHTFEFLGSGPFSPVDPARPTDRSGYRPIDWVLDPVRGLRFPEGIPYDRWDLFKMRPGSADIKLPWELARCQHFAVLGQAYRFTGEAKYALEILRQIRDFVEANPVGTGIHWTCTMDVAIRAVNWLVGLALIRRCSAVQPELWHDAADALFEHGTFIYSNLENKYEVTSNHFLSNIAGLFYLASFFRGLPAAHEWGSFSRRSLQEEMRKQVLDDGADFESSLPYHRLVTEIFLGVARQAVFREAPFSAEYNQSLRRMVVFLLGVLRPDGLMPVVGDTDDGRLHILGEYGVWMKQDARHILGPASFYFNEPDWLEYAGRLGAWEATWWGYDPPRLDEQPEPLPAMASLFDRAGLAVARNEGNYLLISNGAVGTNGFGNHKHNDQLSFELCLDGRPIIVDPGSYVYTADFAARNEYRGTGIHNTLCVDGIEQNEMNPEWLFRLFERARPEHLHFTNAGGGVEYAGRHFGYERLESGVVHTRLMRFVMDEACLLVTDRLTGRGRHSLRWHFHIAPGIEVIRTRDGCYSLASGSHRYSLRFPNSLSGKHAPSFCSPSYGTLIPCTAVDLFAELEISGMAEWSFVLGRTEWLENPEKAAKAEGWLHKLTSNSARRGEQCCLPSL